MLKSGFLKFSTLAATASLLLTVNGCANLPGTAKQQGATIGGLGGAAAGAAIGGEHHRLLGALLGGALGAGGGYIVGANRQKLTNPNQASVQQANQVAQNQPATPQEVASSTTADLNHDGYVTLDEVVAMKEAGLTDEQMLERLQATGQVFELTPSQQNFLTSHGVSPNVVQQMQNLNQETRNELLNQQQAPEGQSVIGQPAGQ